MGRAGVAGTLAADVSIEALSESTPAELCIGKSLCTSFLIDSCCVSGVDLPLAEVSDAAELRLGVFAIEEEKFIERRRRWGELVWGGAVSG
jgi:hypothetical protein